MQYLAQPWFPHQRAVLGASLMDSYRDVLDDLVRQSRHWHSLLRHARVWTTCTDQHYQWHNRRIRLFSVMSQLWASERAAHRVESPLPKRQYQLITLIWNRAILGDNGLLNPIPTWHEDEESLPEQHEPTRAAAEDRAS